MADIEQKMRNPALGYLFVISAALLWGVSGSSAKYLFNRGVTPFELLQIRLTITIVALFLWLLIRNPGLLKIDRKDIVYFTVLGMVGMGGCQSFYLFAISRIHVAAAILLQYLAPALIALYTVVFAREKLSRSTCIALAGAVIGCYLVGGAYNLDLLALNWAGILGGLGAAVTFAWYSIHGEYGMRRYSPWTVLFYAMAFAALLWNVVQPPLGAFMHGYTMVEWGWILYIGIFGTCLPFGLYLEGINLIRSTRASITATLEPITAGIVSYVFLKEVMAPLQLTGAGLIIASIIYLQLNQEQDDKAPARIRARKRLSCQ